MLCASARARRYAWAQVGRGLRSAVASGSISPERTGSSGPYRRPYSAAGAMMSPTYQTKLEALGENLEKARTTTSPVT